MIVLYSFVLHEGLYLRISVPLLAFILISPDVDICVRKKRRHLTKKLIEKLVNLLARGIERRLKNSHATFNRVRTRRTAQLGITNQPTGAMTGYVKLGNDTDGALAGVTDKLPYLVLAVIESIRSHLMKLRKFFALNAKSLILGQMPMQNIELDRRHRIEVALEKFHRLKAKTDIDQ